MVGFVAALRRSELAALTVDRIAEHPNRLVLALPSRTKTNQTGDQVELVVLPCSGNPHRCPVTALTGRLTAAGITNGLVFRGVTKANKPSLRGLHPESHQRSRPTGRRRADIDSTPCSAHSLRARLGPRSGDSGGGGFVTCGFVPGGTHYATVLSCPVVAYVRTVRTASGARAVQIVHSQHRGSREIEVGSADTDGDVELLKAVARQRLAAGQGELDLRLPGGPANGGEVVVGRSSRQAWIRGVPVWPSRCTSGWASSRRRPSWSTPST